MKQITLILFALLSFTKLLSQGTVGNLLTITSTVPPNLTICGAVQNFSVNLNNPTPFSFQSGTVTIVMPIGMNYQVGSIVGATPISVTTNTLVFSIANMPSLSSINITYVAYADCDIIPFLSSGNNPSNSIRVDYLKNGTTALYDSQTTANYVIKQPNLSITNVTNQTYTGAVGDVFTRCITIVNGGLGELSQFSLTDVHASGLQITAVNNGSWTNVGSTETIIFNGTDFTAIGDGDAFFETGESITVCENITINNCIGANSDYKAFWGCNGKECQYSSVSGNVVFPGFVPNLVATPSSTLSSCLGTSTINQQTLTIVNNGTGEAVNTLLKVYQATGFAYNSGLNSEIDISSITIQINGGSINPIIPNQVYNNAGFGCLSSGAKGAFDLLIPSIMPSDNVVIRFNIKNCCTSGTFNGWAFEGTYQNICSKQYTLPPAWGRVYSQIYLNNVTNNGSPASIVSGETKTFNYLLNSVYFSVPAASDTYFKITFSVSPCFNYNANSIKIVNALSTGTYTPSSVTQSGNLITAIFSNSPPFTSALGSSLEQAQVLIDLTANCSSCVSGPDNINLAFYYSTSQNCSCEIPIQTASFPVNLICPVTCEGVNFRNFSIARTSLGLPDNEAGGGDGLPDLLGSLDFTKIKTDRVMYGDTITSTFYGKIKTSGAHPNWQYCFAKSTITNGNNVSSIGGTIKIYRANVLFASGITPSVTPGLPATTFAYNLNATTLTSLGITPVGFTYQDNDSVIFAPKYKVTTNIGGNIILCNVTNTFAVSDIAVPTSSTNLFWCNNFQGYFSIIGYYYTNYGPDSYQVTGCSQVTFNQNYYLSIGPCCNNYAGGNLFPFEYRNWAHIDTFKLTPPVGYQFVSAKFNQVRTRGTFNVVGSPDYAINPVNASSSTLEFPVGSYFSGATPTISLSDDGFYGTFSATLIPTCAVPQTSLQPIRYDWKFQPTSFLDQTYGQNVSTTNGQDVVTFIRPNLTLQSNLISVNVPNDTAGWTLNLSNNSNVAANNVWISAPTISGVSVTKLYDLTTNTLINPIGGIYQLGILNSAASKNYLLVADFTSCTPDSIIVYSGWNCIGYPSSVASYPCTPQKLVLKEVPLLPNLVTAAQGPSGSIPLCSTTNYTVTIDNVQLGTAYTVSLTAILPAGVNIVPGTSKLSYPSANSFVSITDPTFISGTQWRWPISASNGTLNANGLKGVLETTLNKVTLTFDVIAGCGYTSGSAINFQTKALAACGAPTGDEVSLSTNLSIVGANTPYNTQIDMRTTFISPCNLTTPMQIAIHNQGPQATQSTDSVKIELPYGVSYVGGSFVGNTNAPLNTVPYQYTLNNKTYLNWKLPTGIAVGDSCVFTFHYQGDPLKLACVVSPFAASTIFKQNLVCVTGSTCEISIITGQQNLNVFTYKAYLSISGASATSVPTSTGESVSVNFTINNGGEAIQAGVPTTINYYSDSNNNGIYNVGDVFITNDVFTNSILNNGVYSYSATINVPSGQVCKIIALLDTSVNHCSCTPAQILLSPTLRLNSSDITLCSGSTNTVGLQSTTNYTYSWTPITYLNNATVSNPNITPINNTTSPVTYSYSVIVNRGGCFAYDTLNVLTNPKPILSANSASICVGQQTAALIASGASTYTWNTGELTANNNQSPAVNTTYTVIGTDANGCKDTTTADVFLYTLPTLSTTNATICVEEQTATLTVNGALTYTWNTGETTDNVTQTPAINTTYTVVGTDGNACYSSTTASVLVNPLPVISVSQPTICIGQQTATLIASGAFTYTWSTLETTATVTQTPVVTTAYSVIGTDTKGCYGSMTTTITVNNLPNVTANSSTICIGQQIATLLASGATTYSWSSGQTTGQITQSPLLTTDYTVTGIDDNNCVNTATATILVNATPTITANSGTICVGQQTVALTVSGATSYTWSTLESTATIMQSPSATSTYSVIGVDGNGCYAITTTSVLVNNLPIMSANSATICIGQQTATLTANGANSYIWNTLETTATVTQTPVATTVYTVVGTDTKGCYSAVTASVLVNNLPLLNVSPVSICNGQTTTLTVSGANTYTWSNLQTTSSIVQSPTMTSTYTVVGKDNNGCFNVTTSTITVYAVPTVSFVSDSVCLNLATQLTDASNGNGSLLTSYAWDFNNDNIVDATMSNPTFTFNQSGNNVVNYTVTSTPELGLTCKTTTTQNVWVNPLPQPAFVFTNNCVNAQPNSFDSFGSTISAGTNTVYAWSFGDAQTSSSAIATTDHIYATAGMYTVTLTVSSNKGCQKKSSHTVEVYAKPQLIIATTSGVCLGGTTTFTAVSSANSGNVTSWQWDVDNFMPSIEASGESSSYIFATPGSQTLTLLSITDHFCRDTTKLPVYINYYPAPQFSIDVPGGCSDVCVTFTDKSQAIVLPAKINSWEWNFGDGTSTTVSSSNNQKHCYTNPSTTQLAQYSATLTLKTDSGCVATVNQVNIISVLPKPVAHFTSIPDTADVINPEFQFNNTSTNYTKWWWTFGDGSKVDSTHKNPTHTYNTEEPTSYPVTLIISNQFGCKDTVQHTMQIAPQFAFYIPNAFSPTGDKVNDVFTGVGIGITKYEMWIYDRWGEQIYYTDEIIKGWNGRKQGTEIDSKQDVYVWKVEIKDVFGKKHNYVGHVTLLR